MTNLKKNLYMGVATLGLITGLAGNGAVSVVNGVAGNDNNTFAKVFSQLGTSDALAADYPASCKDGLPKNAENCTCPTGGTLTIENNKATCKELKCTYKSKGEPGGCSGAAHASCQNQCTEVEMSGCKNTSCNGAVTCKNGVPEDKPGCTWGTGRTTGATSTQSTTNPTNLINTIRNISNKKSKD